MSIGCVVPSTSFGALVERIEAKAGGRRIPLQGSMELTYRCNLCCPHCWVNLPPGDAAARREELTLPEVRRIVDEVAEAGCLWMLLTGGEVMLRPDFLDIYSFMKERGLLVILFTNGTLITPEVADALAGLPPTRIEVTLYGATRETYERVTGWRGGFERCLRGIELLRLRGVNLDLKTVITNQNLHEFWDLKALIEGLGCKFRYDPLINPRINGSKRPAGERVSPDSVVALELALEEVAEDQRQYLHKAEPFESDSVFKCGAGVNTFHIDPYGNLMTCMMVHTHGFNLRRGSFREGFEEYFPTVIGRRSPRTTRCYSCGLATSCDGCPGWSTLESADLETPVDFLCDVTHERAAAYGALAARETPRTRSGASGPPPLQLPAGTASGPRSPEAFFPLAGVRLAAEVAA